MLHELEEAIDHMPTLGFMNWKSFFDLGAADLHGQMHELVIHVSGHVYCSPPQG